MFGVNELKLFLTRSYLLIPASSLVSQIDPLLSRIILCRELECKAVGFCELISAVLFFFVELSKMVNPFFYFLCRFLIIFTFVQINIINFAYQ
jgi:hypothetical protein